MVRKKRIVLKTIIWPGWGHLVVGKRKKGWFLWGISLAGTLMVVYGMIFFLLRMYVPPPGEEVLISETGVIIAEEEEEKEEIEGWRALFAPLILPLIIILVGLVIRSCVVIYAYRDIRKVKF